MVSEYNPRAPMPRVRVRVPVSVPVTDGQLRALESVGGFVKTMRDKSGAIRAAGELLVDLGESLLSAARDVKTAVDDEQRARKRVRSKKPVR